MDNISKALNADFNIMEDREGSRFFSGPWTSYKSKFIFEVKSWF